MISRLSSGAEARLVLTPNRSISWRALVWVWCSLVVVSTLVTGLMVLAGAWLVVPFAVLELGALAAGLYLAARKCWRQEVLVLGEDALVFESGYRLRKLASLRFPRRYTRVRVEPGATAASAPRLFLSWRDHQVPVGAFLNTAELEDLLAHLTRYGLRIEYPAPRFEGLWWP